MKKLLVVLLALMMVVSLAACGGGTPLKDEEHAAWVAHGQYLLSNGTENSWGGKDTALYEASALKAIALDEVKKIDKALYDTLSGKDVKYLYTIDLIFGTNDAGWNAKFLKDGKLYNANGSYAFKIAQCSVDVDGDNKVYSEEQWISDPHTAYVEALTPDTVFYPTWQEEPDENGFAWDQNPVVTGGAGLYTLVIAQYANASAPGQPGFGVGLVLKEAKEGLAYEEILDFVPADHEYGIIGSFEGSDWTNDVAMEKTGDNEWTGEVTVKAGDEIKVRADGAWDNSWGDGEGNVVITEDGTYEIVLVFNEGTGTIEVITK